MAIGLNRGIPTLIFPKKLMGLEIHFLHKRLSWSAFLLLKNLLHSLIHFIH